jgi:iron(III) transport system substrate-binding protein
MTNGDLKLVPLKVIVDEPVKKNKILNRPILSFAIISFIFSSACQRPHSERSVVIYASVDQVYSEPILKAFQEKTGIRVRPVYDVEASKTTGLVNRLIAEKDRPQADVFWSGEFAQTILLKEKGVLASYASSSAMDIPSQYRDPQGYWTGYAARARVLIVNTDKVSPANSPKSIFDLLSTRWPAEKIGIAYPIFGTTATHAAALYAFLGAKEGKVFFENLRKRGVRVADGNSMVKDLVASGQLMFGLTDTDDACGAKKKGSSVAIIFPDQGEKALGTLIIPNTVAWIANGPCPKEAKELIDFLLSKEVEEKLVESGWCHVPTRQLGIRSACLETSKVKNMEVNLIDVYKQLELVKKELTQVFIR